MDILLTKLDDAIHDMEALQISVSKLRRSGMFETKPVPWIISGLAGAQEA